MFVNVIIRHCLDLCIIIKSKKKKDDPFMVLINDACSNDKLFFVRLKVQNIT